MTAPQHLTNKLNAQTSTGPKSDAGKAISSRNAIAHGLTAKQLIIPGEDPAEYEALRTSTVQHYRPVDEIELRMVENIAECQWRVRRLRAAEVAFYNRSIDEAMTDNPDLAPEEAMALFFTDKVYRQKMSLFLRYQSAVERACDKAVKDLHVERKRRAQLGEPAPALAPAPRPASSSGFVSQPAEDGFVSQFESSNVPVSATILPPSQTALRR